MISKNNDMAGALQRDIPALLRANDINPTPQREVVAGVLFSKCDHLSADQVLHAVNQEGVKVSKATVYNTLNLFAEKGLINTVIVDSNKVFYDSNISAHYHLYNEDTGKIIDLDPDKIKITGLPELPPETIRSGIDVIVRVRNET